MNDLEWRFAFHAATTEEKTNAHTSIRAHCLELAKYLDKNLPDGREKRMAICHLEETMFWGNAAIARDKGQNANPPA